MDCLTELQLREIKENNNSYYSDNNIFNNNNNDSVRADPPTPAKGSTPAREVSPSRGEG